MAGNYLDDVDQFISELGPPDQLFISQFAVGCIVCNPKFIIDRDFNTKAKLVVHFKSNSHAINVQIAETRKEDHITTVEQNLFKINEEIKCLEEQIATDTANIRVKELETIKYKQFLLENNPNSGSLSFQCSKCNFKTDKHRKYKRHLRSSSLCST